MKSEINSPLSVFFVRMRDINEEIVEFILLKWVSKIENQSEFADTHNINEKTVRRIKDDKSYRTSLKTIIGICEGENINLSDFFKEAEKMFPKIKIRR